VLSVLQWAAKPKRGKTSSSSSRKPTRKMKVASESESETGKISDPEDGMVLLHHHLLSVQLLL